MGSFGRKLRRRAVDNGVALLVTRAREEAAKNTAIGSRVQTALSVYRGEYAARGTLSGWSVTLSTRPCGKAKHWHLAATIELTNLDEARRLLESTKAWEQLDRVVSLLMAETSSSGSRQPTQLTPMPSRVNHFSWHADVIKRGCHLVEDLRRVIRADRRSRGGAASRRASFKKTGAAALRQELERAGARLGFCMGCRQQQVLIVEPLAHLCEQCLQLFTGKEDK